MWILISGIFIGCSLGIILIGLLALAKGNADLFKPEND